MNSFKLRLLTPENDFFEGDVNEVIFPTSEGRLGVMAGHAPMIASVTEGIIEILTGDEWKIAAVSKGFADINLGVAEFYVDTVEWSDEIDVLRASEALKRAELKIMASANMMERIRTEAAMSRALARLKAANLRAASGHK